MKREDICTLQIAGIIDSIEPYGTEHYTVSDYTAGFVLLLSRDRLQKEIQNVVSGSNLTTNIYISTENPNEIEKEVKGEIEELVDREESYIGGENLFQKREEEEALSKLVKFLLYGLELIITVFCMMNIFYIISASTLFRTKDFAVLKSIGMSEKQINKMLALEGIFYGFSGLVFGTIFSFAILKIIGHFTVDAELYLFKLPFMSIVYAVVIVYAIIALAMISARRRVKNRNIIEDVKDENM